MSNLIFILIFVKYNPNKQANLKLFWIYLFHISRESWDALDETLKGVPKDAPLMTYCTGSLPYVTRDLLSV